MPKRYILSGIYTLRSVVIVAFLLIPLSPASVYVLRPDYWVPVAVHRAADQRHVAQIFRRAIPVDAGRLRLPSATRSARSWASGWAASSTTPPAATTWCGGIAVALGCFAALVNLPVRESRRSCAAGRQPAAV